MARDEEILVVRGRDEELQRLQSAVDGSHWKIHSANTIAEAVGWLGEHQTPIVLCAAQMLDGSWKDLLGLLRGVIHPPFVAVTSRLADEKLWQEVLDCGGYTVLPYPPEKKDLFQTISGARKSWLAG